MVRDFVRFAMQDLFYWTTGMLRGGLMRKYGITCSKVYLLFDFNELTRIIFNDIIEIIVEKNLDSPL